MILVPSFVRMVLVAAALLSSGVLQVAASLGGDDCCAEEHGSGCPELPPGLTCGCCPHQGAITIAALEVAPMAARVERVALTIAAPSARSAVADIFQPPRA
jgi:hypothetical protein